ncbi:glycoside hydrolase [Lentinula aciculospora]|uniref:beta-N-acetylhexosaminidase n=1 Tax=Lentinula aciculospora TaxID=153920 RepID=A0A9W9A5C4_9AGAR|nr:glycoside hydrolase [Lentinula aciculospora]
MARSSDASRYVANLPFTAHYYFLLNIIEMLWSFNTAFYFISTALLLRTVQHVQPVLAQIPSIKSFTPASSNSNSNFIVDTNIKIVVDSKFANVSSGGSGITLFDFAKTFREDLISIIGLTNISQVQMGPGNISSDATSSTVFLTLGPSNSSNLTLFNGKSTGEGYEFEITEKVYTIRGVEVIGAWWGTRTLLQQVVVSIANGSNSASIPTGLGEDNPGWEIRGFMLDAGRHWFEIPFLADLCTYASFFKINEFHLHASDFIYNPDFLYGADWRDLYTGFRFQPSSNSPIFDLVPELNESWTQDHFTTLQTACSNHGVTIIPEIDTPAHSLVITKWKPELMISGTPDLLNLSYPETIPTLKTIWDEVLPWFSSSEISIGADEYSASLANDYISFVNEMYEYFSSISDHKSIRIWGTNEPSATESINTNVTIQHWWFPGGSIPVQLMDQGYSIINSDQVFLYLDGKFSDGGQFPWTLNVTKLWSGAPGGQGWAPNIFSATDPTNNTSIDNPLLRGSIMALWNDWGNNATTPLEVYYQLAQSLAVFGEKTWAGSGVRESGLTQEEFEEVYPVLNAAAPGQNLNRATGLAQDAVVFNYDTISEFPLETSFETVGPPYTLSFSVKPPSTASSSSSPPLFVGLDSVLYLDSLSFKDPSTNLRYPLGVDIPPDVFTSVEIHATVNYTYALLNRSSSESSSPLYWTSNLDIWGEYMQVVNMSFAAPSYIIGLNGFTGELANVSLRLGE